MRRQFTAKQLTRFWSHVDKSSGPESCWPWTGNRMVNGYGRYSQDLAHSLVYELTYGSHPEDKPCTCHRCDNPPCCNPSHLFAGSYADNNADRVAKGREGVHVSFGEGNGLAKLTESDIREIRRRRATGELLTSIAADFGINMSNVSQIFRRVTWKHIT